MFSDLPGALRRAQVVFGVKSVLIIASFLLSQSLVSVVLDVVQAKAGLRGEAAWLTLTVVLLGVAFARWNHRMRTSAPMDGTASDSLSQRRGLVVLVGLDSDRPDGPTARLLAEASAAEYIVLLGTAQTRERRVAERVLGILAPASGRTFEPGAVRVVTDASAVCVSEFEEATLDAIAWLRRKGLSTADIVVDVSEGRRAMGFGAVRAAESEHVDTQYLASSYDPTGSVRLPRGQWKTVESS
jgi:hypothetical protein